MASEKSKDIIIYMKNNKMKKTWVSFFFYFFLYIYNIIIRHELEVFGKYTILPILEMIMMTDRSIIQEEFGIFGSPLVIWFRI